MSTQTLHVPAAAMFAPVSDMTLVPEVAATTPVVQLVPAFEGVATIRSVGIVSVNVTPVIGRALYGLDAVLLSAKVRVEVSVFRLTGSVPNDLLIDGGGVYEQPVNTKLS